LGNSRDDFLGSLFNSKYLNVINYEVERQRHVLFKI